MYGDNSVCTMSYEKLDGKQFLINNQMKQIFFIASLCFVLALTACGESDSSLLVGRWEYPVKENETGISYSYIIELNMNEPTFVSEFGPEEKKFYGFMDFSNIRRVYHYDIDSVASLGDNLYAIRAVDYNLEMMGVDGSSIDTLLYLPETKQLVYRNDWKFDFIPDLKPFKGKWELSSTEDNTTIYLSLYQTIKAPDEYPYNGAECYGWIECSNQVDNSYRLITKVERVHYNWATVATVFPDYPEDTPQRFDLSYNPSDGTLSYEGIILSPIGEQSVSASEHKENTSFGSTWKDKFLIVWGIVLVVILYYLFKILMGYFFMMLGSAAIGAAAGGLIIWLLMGGFDLNLPRWLIIIIMSITTIPMALIGLWEALKSTGQLARMPFASTIMKGMVEENKGKYGHIVDEDGNKTKITSVNRGILGEKYIETEDGKHYRNDGGNEVREN